MYKSGFHRSQFTGGNPMKKLIAMLLSATLALSLAACSDTEPQPTAPGPTQPAATDPVVQGPTEPPVVSMEMGETVIIDNEKCTFTIKSASQNAYVGMTVDVLLENKSDKTLLFTWNNTSVNGYMHDPFWAEEVAAGKKANSTIHFDTYQLENYGVESVDEIEFTLYVYDSDDFMADPYVNEVFTIYPTGLSAETMVYPTRESKEGEQVIVDNEDVTFIIESAGVDGSFYNLRCYLSNKTDKNVMVSWEDVSVDGFMIDPLWAVTVAGGKQAVTEISFLVSDLTDNGIENPGQIEFKLKVSDYDDWMADPILEQVYTWNS